MRAEHGQGAESTESVSQDGVRLSDWLRDQDARELVVFARAARASEGSFLGHLLGDP